MSRDGNGSAAPANDAKEAQSSLQSTSVTSNADNMTRSSSSKEKTHARPVPVRTGQGLGVSHAQAGYEKPSMWQAPQSLLYPTAPAPRVVSPERQATYFRRVAMPHRVEGPPPAPWQRRAQVMGGVFSAAAAVYMVFFHDFGPKEHVFTRLREIVGSEQMNPFRLSEEEKQWAARRAEADRANKDSSARSSSSRMV